MKLLLETNKYSIYVSHCPTAILDSREVWLSGFFVIHATEESIFAYERWDKSYINTLEKLGKKLYKKAKRIK